MINKLIEFCANNRFIVLLFVSMAVFAGLYSIKNINLTLFQISPTRRSLFIRAGTEARTSLKTRSPTQSSRTCSACRG